MKKLFYFFSFLLLFIFVIKTPVAQGALLPPGCLDCVANGVTTCGQANQYVDSTRVCSLGGQGGLGVCCVASGGNCKTCPQNCNWEGTTQNCFPSSGAPQGTTCNIITLTCSTGDKCDHSAGCISNNNGTQTGNSWGNWGEVNPAVALDTLANFFKARQPGGVPIVKYNTALAFGINILFVIAILLALFYLVWGGFDWLMSGGNKQTLTSARQKVIFAIVGLIIVFLAALIVNLILQFFNVPTL